MAAKSNEYKQAQNIINTLDVNDKVLISISHVPKFRKYLRELVFKAGTTQQYATRIENDKLKIVRIR